MSLRERITLAAIATVCVLLLAFGGRDGDVTDNARVPTPVTIICAKGTP